MEATHPERPPAAGWKRDLALLLGLVVVGLGVKTWLLTHTTVLTRDGVGHILLAAKLDAQPWAQALNESRQHPLYSIQVLGVAKLIRWWTGEELDVLDWQVAAQWANILAGVLLAVPMYLLGKELFGRRAGFWAALCFQVLTVPARVTADVLIEGVYLFWAANALLFAAWGFRRQSNARSVAQPVVWFALSGLAGGLSYLARPEGVVVILAAGFVLVAKQLATSIRLGWARTLACGSALGMVAALTVAPYCWTIGGLTVKISPQQMLNPNATISQAQDRVPLLAREQWREESPASVACQPAVAHSLLLAVRFSPGAGNDVWDDAGLGPALYAVGGEAAKTFGYVLWLPAIVGLIFYRRRMFADPRLALVLVAAGGQLLLVLRLAMTARYVSERHTLLIVLCGLPLAVAALFELASRVRPGRRWSALTPNVLAIGFVLTVLGFALPKTLKPLHAHRLGHRQAGEWLARHWQPGDGLADPYGWVRFYSGEILTTLNRRNAWPATQRHYIVVEPGDPDEERNRIMKTVSDRFGLGEPVYFWPDAEQPRVVIHRVQERPRPSGVVAGPVEQPHQR